MEGLYKRYEKRRSALLPILFIAQKEFGALDDEILALIASEVGIEKQEVWDVATFYSMFDKEKTGKYNIQVCANLSCYLAGSFRIVEYLSNKLGVEPGRTTPDGVFTLTLVECLGSCGTAPTIMVNETFYESVTKESLDALIESLKAGEEGGAQ